MNHPKHEEWAPYLLGETDAASRGRLREHLRSCAVCREEIAAWKRTLGRLDSWKLQEPPKAGALLTPIFRWAAAAAIILCVGFVAGRSSRPARADIAAAVRAETQAQLHQELPAALAADHRATLELLKQLETQQVNNYVSLRRDLETLATAADDRLQRNGREIVQLETAYHPVRNDR